MGAMEEVVDISDNNDDDDDDCVFQSVTSLSKQVYTLSKDYEEIFKETPMLAEVIEKFVNLESSSGMYKVINQIFLRIYKQADVNYKASPEFESVLKRTMILLDRDPSHKYTHIKTLCETLQASEFKKRVKLITLSKSISDKNIIKRDILKRSHSRDDKSRKKRKTAIIDLEKDEEPSVINLDNDQNDSVVILEDSPSVTEDNKENYNTEELNESSPEKVDRVQDENLDHVQESDDSQRSVDKLLVPQKIVEYSETDKSIDAEIKSVKLKIARYKAIIAKLDEEEVTEDNFKSPYLKSERLKAKILSLYEQLCNLTGTSTAKRCRVQLKVIEGHPAGPVRKLEEFLNNNVGSDGNPQFPDFRDVIECVLQANNEENLGWTQHQIIHEATALFTYCGSALQKRRQKREWNDLLWRLKSEKCDDDPANNDPELLARLEANKKCALKKEAEVLERFSMMQCLPPSTSNGHVGHNVNNDTEKPDSIRNKQIATDRLTESSDTEMVTRKLSKHSIEYNTDDSDSDFEYFARGNKSLIKVSPVSNKNSEKNYSGTNEINKVNDSTISNDSLNENSETNYDNVKIKEEPTDAVVSMLDDFGEDYSVSVLEVEDPFLVIEIMDSSDEE